VVGSGGRASAGSEDKRTDEACGTMRALRTTLKNAAEALVDEATPSEEALLASLQSARPEWRKNMAATLRDSVRDRQPKSSWWRAVFAWPAPAYAFAGIVAVAVVAWIGVRALHPPSAEQLLAQAYTEHRTLEVRIPGARYAPDASTAWRREIGFRQTAIFTKGRGSDW
jgi:hypothetical protein